MPLIFTTHQWIVASRLKKAGMEDRSEESRVEAQSQVKGHCLNLGEKKLWEAELRSRRKRLETSGGFVRDLRRTD